MRGYSKIVLIETIFKEGGLMMMQEDENKDSQFNHLEDNQLRVNRKCLHNIMLRIKKDLSSTNHAWVILLWLILLVVNLYQGSQIYKMRTEMKMLQESVDAKFEMITNGINYLQYNTADEVTGRVGTLLNQSMSEVDSYSIRYTDVNLTDHIVTVEITTKLKRYENDAIYQATILNLGDHSTTTEVLEGDQLIRTCTLVLSYENNYTIDISRVNKSGGAKITVEPISLLIPDMILNRTIIQATSAFRNNVQAIALYEFSNNTYHNENASIDHVEAILSYQSNEFMTILLSEVPLDYNSATLSEEGGKSSSTVSSSVTTSSNTADVNDSATTVLDKSRGMSENELEAVSEYEQRKFELDVTLDTIRMNLSSEDSKHILFTDIQVYLVVTYKDGSKVRLKDAVRL